MNYKIGFYKKPQGIFTRDFIKEIEREITQRGDIELVTGLDYRKMYVKNGKVYFEGGDLSDLDVYFWHDVVGAKVWKGDNYHLNVLRSLENSCVVVNSAESTRVVNDKFFSHIALSQASLPVADFALVNLTNKQAIVDVFNSFDKEVLIKPRFRGFGTGIVRVSSEQQLIEIVELLQSSLPNGEDQMLIEKYYKNDIEKWISVVVLGEKVLFGYRKKLLGDSDWKVYDPERKDSKGEFTDYVDPPDELKQVALEARRAIGKDIICFDFIHTEEGYKIIDENGRPGLYKNCLEGAGIDIKKEIVDLIFSKIN